MKIHLKRRFRLKVGLFLGLAGGFSQLSDSISAAPRPSAVMLGRAVVKRKNLATTTTLQANDRLYAGDIVATGGVQGATVQFADGSRVDMAGRSVLEITSPVNVGRGKLLFRALNGRMAAHLRPGKVVATRTALVRVRGTVILISVEDDGTSTLAVLEGSAEFFNPCGSVLVPAGSQSVAQPGNAPSAPAAIPDVQSLLNNWRNQNDVLAPFVTPAAQPVANIIGNGRIASPTRLPNYLRDAVDKLKTVPASERFIVVSALAKIKLINSSDCGCGIAKVSP